MKMTNKLDFFLLSLYNLSNKLVIALLFTLSYYSLFVVLSPYISFFLTIPAFIVSFLIAMLFYKLGGKLYKTFFINRARKNLADIVTYEANLNDRESFVSKRYYLEYNIILASFAFAIFVLTYLLQTIGNTSSTAAILNLRLQYLSHAIMLYFSYVLTSIIVGLLYKKITIFKKEKSKVLQYVCLYFLLFGLVITVLLFLKSYYTILLNLM